MTPYLRSPSLSKISRLTHGFFTRHSGIAKGEESCKHESIQRITHALGARPEELLTLCQVHSSIALVVDAPFAGEPPQADALISQTPGLLLGVYTADCVPILLGSSRGEVVAAVHAGWRGAVASIVENTVQKMQSLGAREIVAAIGPCIWQPSYEVSEEFYEKVPQGSDFFIKGNRPGHWLFDLPGYVSSRLLKSGVQQVEASVADTYADRDQFFSYRRKTHHPEEELKSNLSAIGIFHP